MNAYTKEAKECKGVGVSGEIGHYSLCGQSGSQKEVLAGMYACWNAARVLDPALHSTGNA